MVALVVVGASVLQALWVHFQLGGPTVTQTLSDVIPVPVTILTALACWRRARCEQHPKLRRAWRLIGAAALSWGVGEAIWSVYELSGRQPFPSPADAGFLIMIPLAVAGVITYSTARHPVWGGMRSMVDGLVLAGSLLFISWTVVLGTAVHQAPASPLAQVLALSYPLGDVVIIAIVMHVLATRPPGGQQTLGTLGAGLVSIAVADTVFLWFTEHAGYSGGNINDALWTFGFALIAVAAIRRTPTMTQTRGAARARAGYVLVPYGPLGVAVAGAVWTEMRRGGIDLFQFWAGTVVIVCVLVRQFIAVRENVALTRAIAVQAEANALAASILTGTDDAVVGFDADGLCSRWNPAAEQLFGYRGDEILGRHIADLAPSEYQADARRFMTQVLAGTPLRREMRFRHRDGRRIEAAFTVSPVTGPNGEIIGASIIGRDISARKHAERALRQSEHRFVQFAEQLPVGLVVIDRSLDVVYANGKALELCARPDHPTSFPAPAADVFYELFQTAGGLYELRDVPAVRALRGELDAVADDLEVRRPDGTVSLEAWANPIHDEKGRIVYAIAAFTDISSRREVEANLRESERQLEEAQQLAHIGSWTWNMTTGAVKWSDEMCRIYGRPLGSPPKTHDDFVVSFHPDDRPDIGQAVLAALGARQPFHIEHRIVRPDGEERWVDVRGAVVGEATFHGTAQDVTERRAVSETLRLAALDLARSNEDLGQFAYVASHDLQEPLRMVTAYLKLLSDRYRGQLGDDADEFIGYAVSGAARMQALIEGLLAYSRAGTEERVVTVVDTTHIAEQTLDGLSQTIREREAIVTVDPLPTLTGDSLQLGRLLQNLVANAIKFSPADTSDVPRVHITAEPHDGTHWCISVSDNGIGIDASSPEQIFQPFKRLHSSSAYPGSGMGLAICKRIVERHDGRLWLETNSAGGSTFRFTLPGSPPRATRPLQILLAEDNPGDVRLIREALADGVPSNVHVAATGDAALDFLRHAGEQGAHPEPDLVILDVSLPRKSGLEVLEAAAARVDHIPFVVLSTSNDVRDIRRAYELRARCFVTKPFDAHEFAEVVRRVRDFVVPSP